MSYKFIIAIGDPSADGHGGTEDVILECNHTVEEVQEAYLNSCALTGVSFHGHGSDMHIATEYEDSIISENALTALKEHGLDVREDLEDVDDDEEVYIEGSDHFTYLLMRFIKLSLPDLTWEEVKNDLPYLNRGGKLRAQMGYGLFY